MYKRRVVSRVNANATANNLPAADPLSMISIYIENVNNMLAPDTREVYRIYKAMKAMFGTPAATGVKEEGGDKKEGAEKREGGGEEKNDAKGDKPETSESNLNPQ